MIMSALEILETGGYGFCSDSIALLCPLLVMVKDCTSAKWNRFCPLHVVCHVKVSGRILQSWEILELRLKKQPWLDQLLCLPLLNSSSQLCCGFLVSLFPPETLSVYWIVSLGWAAVNLISWAVVFLELGDVTQINQKTEIIFIFPS